MADGSVLEIAEIHGIAESTVRVRQKAKAWPAGTVIVSADSHWLEGDIWFDRFPAHLRDRAPRMVFEDGGWQTIIDGKLVWPPAPEVAAAFCAPARDRLFFVAVPNYWDPSATAESMQEIKALGASALLVPRNPRKDAHGDPITWPSDKMTPFWKAVEDSGLPLCFHIGERVDLEAGAAGTGFLINTQGFRSAWGDLTFGGVFDCHPRLKVVFVEAGLNWGPGMLHDADLAYHSFAPMIQPKLAHTPSWYWRVHC